MITERQEKILIDLIKNYLDAAEPISSSFLKERCGLAVSPATIRNDLQELTEKGYIYQPHTSAGRIPTNKAYKYFVNKIFEEENNVPDFIFKEIEETRKIIEKELEMAKNIMQSFTDISESLALKRIEEDMLFDVLRIIGSSRTAYDKNIDIMRELLKELENF